MLKNAIVGQSGGPTSVINASLAGVFKTARDLGLTHIYGMRNGIEGLLSERYVDLGDYIKNDVDIELLKGTPSAFLGSCRYKLPHLDKDEDIYKKLFGILEKLDIGYFFYIGGNDSMDTIAQLALYAERINSEIRFIGVPKTIDNDLVITDHTPGFGSAAKYVATSIKEIIRDGRVYDNNAVSIIEIMGRDAGWLTGSAALSTGPDCSGPDLIYLPEIVFDVDSFISRVEEVQRARRSVIVCVSEGIRTSDGNYVCEYTHDASRTIDAFGHKQLTGTARVLGDVVKERLGCKVRAIEFSLLQRCAAHMQSETDVKEAFHVGVAAARAAMDGETGKVIIIKREGEEPYQSTMGSCDVHLIANYKKDVPREWINEAGDYVLEEFISYARPLISGETTPVVVNGLPRHIENI
ncbi:MAG: 6-phosphofructokinase [Oscillospiraceae bacterium]|nr:6-phosphofructokinase [Oscillospiraceae bacterium]